jgi:hypothetical protein
MEIAVKMAEMSSEGRGRRRRRGGLPRRRHHGERRPLALFFHGFMGALPHGDGVHGGRKRGSSGCKFVGGGVPHELGFLPLYSFSDFRLPILGRTRSGLTWPFGLGIGQILCTERLP